MVLFPKVELFFFFQQISKKQFIRYLLKKFLYLRIILIIFILLQFFSTFFFRMNAIITLVTSSLAILNLLISFFACITILVDEFCLINYQHFIFILVWFCVLKCFQHVQICIIIINFLLKFFSTFFFRMNASIAASACSAVGIQVAFF